MLVLTLPEDIESRLKSIADRLGIDPADYANKLLARALPPAKVDQATLDLLARWDIEDQTDDPKEIAKRQKDFEDLKNALNETRRITEGPDARMIFP
jgi:hypothetical protein